jgi:hypothetical protein
VAAYQGSPERKRFAVDAVRAFRSHGIPAYYYHGETISSVCIGTWPRSAVKEQGVRDDAHTVDPSQPILVLADKAPPGINPELHDADGKKVLIVAPRLEILDPSMLETIGKYPRHSVNGEDHAKIADGQQVFDPSFLVEIHHEAYAGAAGPEDRAVQMRDAVRAAADDAAAALLDQQPATAQPQPARLRSIGDK